MGATGRNPNALAFASCSGRSSAGCVASRRAILMCGHTSPNCSSLHAQPASHTLAVGGINRWPSGSFLFRATEAPYRCANRLDPRRPRFL
jgi:hypothetical protein